MFSTETVICHEELQTRLRMDNTLLVRLFKSLDRVPLWSSRHPLPPFKPLRGLQRDLAQQAGRRISKMQREEWRPPSLPPSLGKEGETGKEQINLRRQHSGARMSSAIRWAPTRCPHKCSHRGREGAATSLSSPGSCSQVPRRPLFRVGAMLSGPNQGSGLQVLPSVLRRIWKCLRVT